MAPVPTTSGLIPYVSLFPSIPSPLVIRNWKQTATDYHQLAFNAGATGQHLPLLYQYSANTSAGYTGSAFGLPSYVGQTAGSGEALSVLGAVYGGTLAGLNMASLNGADRVQQCEVFYSSVNGHGLVLNNVNSQGSSSAWYDIFPSILFYEIGSRYPGRASLQSKMIAIADSWRSALPVLSNNWEHTGFNFNTMTPTNLAWNEPDMAIGIAWLEYMAYAKFNDANYLTAADTCMAQMDSRATNPIYEVLGYYGAYLAARMNAQLGRTYSIDKHLRWVFASGSTARPGWGCESARWGSCDAYGLMGSTTDTSGYAFAMNTFAAAGAIAPLCRYAPQYAPDIGRWLLHVAANANLFVTDTLPSNMQSSATWAQQTGVTSITYEGVRNQGATTPYATGDATSPVQEFTPYGAWGTGIMASLFETTNVSGILKVDCLATESFAVPSHPTFLFSNPYSISQQVNLILGASPLHLYDCVTGRFVARNVSGSYALTLPAGTSMVLVYCPTTTPVAQTGSKLVVGGVVVDYGKAATDQDSDGLPDWWESLYFGSTTTASPSALTTGGITNLQCYALGLDPMSPQSNFVATVTLQTGTGRAQITWPTVSGKTYAVQFADSLNSGGASFTTIKTVNETSGVTGSMQTRTFIDDFTLTGGAPTNGRRFFRIQLAQ